MSKVLVVGGGPAGMAAADGTAGPAVGPAGTTAGIHPRYAEPPGDRAGQRYSSGAAGSRRC